MSLDNRKVFQVFRRLWASHIADHTMADNIHYLIYDSSIPEGVRRLPEAACRNTEGRNPYDVGTAVPIEQVTCEKCRATDIFKQDTVLLHVTCDGNSGQFISLLLSQGR